MPISHKYKTIFIHIPKNAGESMEKKLGIYGDQGNNLWGIHKKYVLQHLTLPQMKRHYVTKDLYRNYFKFAFVRNPWDKTVSEYYWYLRYGSPLSFDDWVRTLGERLKKSTGLHILEVGHNIPQYKYVCDKNLNLAVDFIGRFEQLQNDFDQVCETLGIEDTELAKDNATTSDGRKHYKEYYSKESKKIIAKIYKKDIELFDYKF